MRQSWLIWSCYVVSCRVNLQHHSSNTSNTNTCIFCKMCSYSRNLINFGYIKHQASLFLYASCNISPLKCLSDLSLSCRICNFAEVSALIYIRADGSYSPLQAVLCCLPSTLALFTTLIFLLFSVSNYCCINSIRETISCVIGQLAWGSGSLSSFITNTKPNWKLECALSPWERLHIRDPQLTLSSILLSLSLFLSSLHPPSPLCPVSIPLSPLPVISPCGDV